MKIKERNKKIVYVAVGIIVLYFVFFLKDIISTPDYLLQLSIKSLFIHFLFIGGPVYLIVSTIYGSFIQVENGLLIISEGYLKSRYLLDKIKGIKVVKHLFLGPTLFINEVGSNTLKKLLVIGNYQEADIRVLIKYLKEQKSINVDSYLTEFINKN